MDGKQAAAVADALGGNTWQSGGDIWLVLINSADGTLVVVSDDAVCEYPDQEAFNENDPFTTIVLQ